MNSSVQGRRGPVTVCMHAGANRSAERTPAHGVAGSGAFQRRGPTGGAAYGTPLNTCTAASRPDTPASRPPETVTETGPAACKAKPAHAPSVARTGRRRAMGGYVTAPAWAAASGRGKTLRGRVVWRCAVGE